MDSPVTGGQQIKQLIIARDHTLDCIGQLELMIWIVAVWCSIAIVMFLYFVVSSHVTLHTADLSNNVYSSLEL